MAQLINTQLKEKENDNSNKSSNHTLWNHEERFYKVLEHLKKKFEVGSINQEEYDIMREKAIADESSLRRKDIEYATALFGTRNAKEGEITYYHQKISELLDELYISCKYSTKEKERARFDNFGYLVKHTNNRGNKLIERDKKIYEDLVSGKLDMLHTSGEELLKIYGD